MEFTQLKNSIRQRFWIKHFENLLKPIMETCTKDSISSGKSWMFQQASDEESNLVLAEYLAWKVTNESTSFTKKLHLIYLVNDVLHHCIRKSVATNTG